MRKWFWLPAQLEQQPTAPACDDGQSAAETPSHLTCQGAVKTRVKERSGGANSVGGGGGKKRRGKEGDSTIKD